MTVFQQLGKALTSLAPTLATMLGGPLAGTAVTAVEGALGLTPGAGAQACLNALQSATMTPDQLVALKQADLKHQEVMGQQQIDLAKLNQDAYTASLADMASARQMYESVKDKSTPVMAWTVLISTVIVAGLVLTGHVTKDQAYSTDVGVVIGYLFSEAKAVLQFYFGSSADSQSKTATISKIAEMP